MTRWRLLALFLILWLVLVLAAPAFLRGQDAATDRDAALSLDLARSRYVLPIDLLPPLPPPRLPRRDPIPIFPRTGLKQMVYSAGIIFSGRVTFVGRADPASKRGGPAATTVTFQVEHAMLGTSTGHSLTIHEWAGLWARGGDRYRVGERVFLFLYPPSKLGLTSPVAGAMGKFALDPRGRILITTQHARAFADDPILGSKAAISLPDFAQAVRRAHAEE